VVTFPILHLYLMLAFFDRHGPKTDIINNSDFSHMHTKLILNISPTNSCYIAKTLPEISHKTLPRCGTALLTGNVKVQSRPKIKKKQAEGV